MWVSIYLEALHASLQAIAVFAQCEEVSGMLTDTLF